MNIEPHVELIKNHGDFWEAHGQDDLLPVVENGTFLFKIKLYTKCVAWMPESMMFIPSSLKAMISIPILSPTINGIPAFIYDIVYDSEYASTEHSISARYTQPTKRPTKIAVFSAIMECSEPFKISHPTIKRGEFNVVAQYRKHMGVLKNIGV